MFCFVFFCRCFVSVLGAWTWNPRVTSARWSPWTWKVSKALATQRKRRSLLRPRRSLLRQRSSRRRLRWWSRQRRPASPCWSSWKLMDGDSRIVEVEANTVFFLWDSEERQMDWPDGQGPRAFPSFARADLCQLTSQLGKCGAAEYVLAILLSWTATCQSNWGRGDLSVTAPGKMRMAKRLPVQ